MNRTIFKLRRTYRFFATCKNCGVRFRKWRKTSDRKYCSQRCYKEDREYFLECKSCGRIFLAKIYNVKYCIKCRTKKCEYCGKEFLLTSGEVDGGCYNVPKKYCSQKCYHSSTIGKEAHNKEKGEDIICVICGKQFNVWKSRKEFGQVKYCSRECKYEGQSRVRNVNHPLWKGGRNKYTRLLSKSIGSFHRNRRIVLERDEHTCQKCGYEGPSSYMDVHHIIKVMKLGTNQLSNMITLCRKCHNKADKGKISISFLKRKLMNQYCTKYNRKKVL